MAMSIPSEQLQLLIAGYVLGDLTLEEAAEFEQLLAQDPAIAEEVAQMQIALETAYAPPEVLPPAHLRSAILASADAVSEPRMAAIKPRRNWGGRAIAVAAAALIVALAVNNYRLWKALQTARLEAQYATLTYSLQPTTAESGTAIVAINPNSLKATLEVRNLPPLPPGKVYVLWTVLEPNAPFTTDAKNAILTEVFEVDDRGSFSRTITVPKVYRQRELVAKVAVTIEDAKFPQRHLGAPVAITKP